MSRTVDDDELARLTLQGDREAFHRLIERYYRPVGGFILKRVQRADVVEDLVQETFLEAFQALRAGRTPRKFSSWLFGIAHNRSGKWLRRKRPLLFSSESEPVFAAVPSEQALIEEREEHENVMIRLRTHLERLPEETRRLLELKHEQGKTCEEIALATGRPVGTIKSLLARTYRWLREALATAPEGNA